MISRRKRFVASLFAATLSAVLVTTGYAMGSARPPAQIASGLQIVFAAWDRDETSDTFGYQQIYVANGDGSNVRQVTHQDGYWYDWVSWAMNGTKIVFTARTGAGDQGLAGGVDEGVYLMNADGNDRIRLTRNSARNVQPKISPDGRTLVFNSLWDDFPRVAIYKMDLATFETENLSARFLPNGGRDADPRFSADGRQVVVVSSMKDDGSAQPGQIVSMAVDGSWRRQLTDDTYYNTDPSLSPDGRYVAISSYRGEDRPKPGTNERLEQHAWDWQLVVRDLQTNTERVLTKGLKECLHRFRDPCDPSEAVAWAPQWSPDGRRIGYLSIRGPESGLFVIDADGSNARALVTSKTRTVTYWDWVVAGDPPSGAVEAIGSKLSNSRMLYGARVFDFEIGPGMKPPPVKLFSATDDRFATQELKLSRSDLVPQNARWTPNRKGVVFAARVPIDRSKETPEPEPPDGASRNIHFSFSELDTVLSTLDLPRPSEDVGELQLFLMDTDSGKVHQLTTPWTEDYLDAIPDGEARGNTDPDMSPDGRYVVFTNLGGSSFESWVLRRDLASGEVINLTNMTAGAIPTADSKPRFSPDGSRIAFMSATVNTTQVYVMDRDGLNVRQVTDDDYVNLDPTWSPDGRWLAYSSYRGDDLIAELEDEAAITTRQIPMDDWYLVKVDVETGIQEVLTRPTDSPVFRPVWSPDGERIAFISSGRSPQPDVFVVNADGTNVRELQITLLSKEEFLDWR